MSHHGNTPAAWISMGLATLGFLIGGIAVMLSPINMVLFWVGVVLAVVAFPLWAVLNKMGYGD